MDELIQKLIAQAVNGRIVVNDCYYNIGFDTIIRDGSREKSLVKITRMICYFQLL